RFAYEKGVARKLMRFETLDGVYEAKVHDGGEVSIYFPDVDIRTLKMEDEMVLSKKKFIHHHGIIGVPHTVVFSENVKGIDDTYFEKWGREIRHQPVFPEGTNVNCVEVTGPHALTVRTYERGVEEETLACGSGACASAVFSALLNKGVPPFNVQTMGGVLHVDFKKDGGMAKDITLSGNAVIVYEGMLTV